jgi:hypothetical protein
VAATLETCDLGPLPRWPLIFAMESPADPEVPMICTAGFPVDH